MIFSISSILCGCPEQPIPGKAMNRSHSMFLLLAVALFPSTAMANVGTPLMWASMLHLAVGNAVIGIIEGSLLARMFKCPKLPSILILIAANYASAWAGGVYLLDHLASLPDITILNIRYWFLVYVLVAFVLTLLIEFPFFWLAMRSQKHSLRRALVATPVIHGISYALLLAWYWLASGTSMMTGLQVVSVAEMKISEPFSLYYLSLDGKKLLQMDLSPPGPAEVVSELASRSQNDRLFVRARADSGYNLYIYLRSGDRRTPTESPVLEDFSEQAPVEWVIDKKYSETARSSWFNFGPVPAIGTKSDWTYRTGFWPVQGIRGENEKTGSQVYYSLELPFAAWPVRNATQISGDYVVAQLGKDQICMMHLESGRIALITRGKGPIVAKPKKADKTVDSKAVPVIPAAEPRPQNGQP